MVTITEQELEYYRKHPELVQAVGDKTIIFRVVLGACPRIAKLTIFQNNISCYSTGYKS